MRVTRHVHLIRLDLICLICIQSLFKQNECGISHYWLICKTKLLTRPIIITN
jgi:hypothetical protein